MKISKYIAVIASVMLLFSCATTGPSDKQQDAIETALMQGNTAVALAELDAAMETYSEQAVYDLDYGMLSFYNGDYENAISALTEAEGYFGLDYQVVQLVAIKTTVTLETIDIPLYESGSVIVEVLETAEL